VAVWPIGLSGFAQQTNSNQSKLDQTPRGRLAAAFIEAVNSGDKLIRQAFVNSRISDSALKATPTEEWLALFQKLFKQSNGLEVVQGTPEGADVLNVVVRTRSGNHCARLVIISSQSAPEKLGDLFVLPALDPAIEEKTRFPKSKVSEGEVSKAIEQRTELRVSLDLFSGVVLVAKGDRIVVNHAYGMAEKGFNAPNNLTTKFHLGSMDKMFTGVAIAQLVQAGKLSFNDTLAKVLPSYPNRQVAEKVTIYELLTHTAGTGDFIQSPDFRAHREDFRNTADYLPLIADQALLFPPGTRWAYSNSGYVVLGLVIEKISGQSYFDYVKEHIFKIAGMSDTGYYELNEIVPNRAVGYLRDPGEDPFGLEPRRSNVMFIPFKGNSAGGGYSTASDLLKFTQALRGHKLLNAEMTELVTSGKVDMVGAPMPEKYGYGFIGRTVNGKELRGNSGGGAGSGVDASLEMFWDGSYTVIVLSNYDAPGGEDLQNDICEFLAFQ
jgi:CubicO group peptidase (beta-lactamase class C family)